MPGRFVTDAGLGKNTKDGLSQLARSFLVLGVVDIRIAK
ncbi:Uncharacterised protein [Mycobacterium tuberculosis]|nr:Uncharacterised protein [Mycobacterium tuberculosis]